MTKRNDHDKPQFAEDSTSAWRAWLLAAGLPAGEQLRISSFDPAAAVVIERTEAHKIVVREQITLPRRNSLAGEAAILDACAGIGGIPRRIALSQTGDVDVLTLGRLDGTAMADVRGWRRWMALLHVAVLLGRISRRGVGHNDVTEANVLVLDEGHVALLDFDQATVHHPIKALVRNFIGARGHEPVYGSFWTLITATPRRVGRRFLSPRTRRLLRRPGVPQLRPLPLLPPGAPRCLVLLRRAWSLAAGSDASAPGVPIAYYQLTVDGYTLPGERPWAPRWDVLRDVVPFEGKRVLELGSNLALLSIFCLREADAFAALAVDHDPQILKAASLAADAFDVQLGTRCVDFDGQEKWENDLAAFQPDVVFALNVLNWVGDKTRLLAFLRRFPVIVLEGHESLEEESERLRDKGFDRVEHVATSERGRPVLVASKSR